ncbi:MAG: beta/gamma crystallin-related protein [Gemmatimonadaceae bacterium]
MQTGWNLVVYDQANYAGNSANFTSSASNLGPQWRRMARSININGGTWQVCEDPNFNGRCVTLTQSAPDLGTYNLRRIGSVRPVRQAGTYNNGTYNNGTYSNGNGTYNNGNGTYNVSRNSTRGWSITVYPAMNYRGTARRYTAAVSNLGRQPIRSINVGRGSWEVCSGANYTGDCITLDQSAPDLRTEGFSGYVRSIRPANRR